MYAENHFIATQFDIAKYTDINRFSYEAMATVFEVFIKHDNIKYAEKTVWQAFDRLEKIEQDLSRFIDNSEISQISRLKAGQKLTISMDAFECLRQAIEVCKITNGAFDITVSQYENPHSPVKPVCPNDIALSYEDYSVTVLKDNISIDLGGIGKGYAVDEMAKTFDEFPVGSALISGGKSSVLTLNKSQNKCEWKVNLIWPYDNRKLGSISINNIALGSSGLAKGLHILNPITGNPAKEKKACWVFAQNAAIADGLSTACMVMENLQIEKLCNDIDDLGIVLAYMKPQGEENKINITKLGTVKNLKIKN